MNDLFVTLEQLPEREVIVVGFPTQCTDLRNGVEIEGCSTDFSNRRASNRIVLGMTDRHGDVHLKDGHIHLVPK